MSNEIVRREQQGVARQPQGMEIIPGNFGELMSFAEVAYHSGLFPKAQNVAAAAMKIQAGAEMGLSPITSLRSLHVFEGKVEMSAHLMLAQCQAAGFKIKVLKADDQAVMLEWYAPDGEVCGPAVGFTRRQAETAGLMKRRNWMAYTEDMLWARAVSRGARRYCASVMHGIYVDGEISQAPRQQVPQTTPQPQPATYDPANDPEGAAAADAHIEQLADPGQHPGEGWKKASARLHAVMREVGVSIPEIKACLVWFHNVDSSKKLNATTLGALATAVEKHPGDDEFANHVEQLCTMLGDAPTDEMINELRNDHCDTPWRLIALERALVGGGEG